LDIIQFHIFVFIQSQLDVNEYSSAYPIYDQLMIMMNTSVGWNPKRIKKMVMINQENMRISAKKGSCLRMGVTEKKQWV